MAQVYYPKNSGWTKQQIAGVINAHLKISNSTKDQIKGPTDQRLSDTLCQEFADGWYDINIGYTYEEAGAEQRKLVQSIVNKLPEHAQYNFSGLK